MISAALVLSGFFLVLHNGGWHLHAATGNGAALHHLYQQATTVAWLGIVTSQIGTAFAARTDRASLRSIGLSSNPLLLAGISIELLLAAALVYLPFLHPIFGTATPTLHQLIVVLPYPFIVWGADETRRWIQRHRHPTTDTPQQQTPPPAKARRRQCPSAQAPDRKEPQPDTTAPAARGTRDQAPQSPDRAPLSAPRTSGEGG